MKENNGEPPIASPRFWRRIHHSVQGRNPVIIRLPRHEIALVDNKRILNRGHVMPFPFTICNLQPANRFSRPQDCNRPVVGMRASPQLTRQWGNLLFGIEAQSKASNVTIDLVIEELFRKVLERARTCAADRAPTFPSARSTACTPLSFQEGQPASRWEVPVSWPLRFESKRR